jgi:hypothetical protein
MHIATDGNRFDIPVEPDATGWWNVGSDSLSCYDKIKLVAPGDTFPLTFTNGVAVLNGIPALGGVRPRYIRFVLFSIQT